MNEVANNPMDYIEWVERVMVAVAEVFRNAGATSKLLGIDEHAVVRHLGFDDDTYASEFRSSKLSEAVGDALTDLERMGLIEGDGRHYKLTREGNKFPQASLKSAWPVVMEMYVDDDQLALLRALAASGQEIYDGFACVTTFEGRDIFERMGWAWDDEGSSKGYLLGQQLSDMAMVRYDPRMGGYIRLTPTYVGIVRATKEVETELGALVRSLLDDWETTNVDFKRELDLSKDKQKAEFIRDILGLATTKSSGRRFLVIGFDDKTRDFHESVNPGVSQDQMESIIHAYCEPAPSVSFHHVPWNGGEVGLVEAVRDPARIPYRVKKALGGSHGIQVGDLYVRHGSHTEKPTAAELENLIEEGEIARRLQ